MSQERSKILQMLDEGQVTVDEATVLLKTLQSSPTPAQIDTVQRPTPDQVGNSFLLGAWIKRLASVAVKQKVEEELAWEINSVAVQTITVQTVNGSIQYTGADQQSITVHAHKIVRAPDVASAEAFARQVQIHSEIQDGILQLYPEHPKPPRHVAVEVTFTISGPRTINVTGHSTNGNVHVQSIAGVAHAHSTNGDVQVNAITGTIQAQTTNGNIRATALTLHGTSEFTSQNGSLSVDVEHGQPSIKAGTVNGSVRLHLPVDYTGHLDARTENGQVRTNFPSRTTQLARNHILGQIGATGEARLKLRSQNGNVTLAMKHTV